MHQILVFLDNDNSYSLLTANDFYSLLQECLREGGDEQKRQ